MLITIEEGILESSVGAGKLEDAIKVECLADTCESGKRLIYQIAELLIYFGWPIAVMWVLRLSFPMINPIIVGAVGIFVFMWPGLKGYIGLLVARLTHEKDPRHSIRSSSFWFDGFLFYGSEALREIRRYSALSRSLDMICNRFNRFGINASKRCAEIKPIKWWTDFWIGMPIAQDVRSRLDIIAEEYRKILGAKAAEKPGQSIHILEVAGGQLQAIIMGISRAIAGGTDFTYQVVSIEPEMEFAKARALELIEEFALDKENFTFIDSKISTKEERKFVKNILLQNGQRIGYDIVACVGLGDYYFSASRIEGLLGQLDLGDVLITANISGNFVERRFLHVLIQWPKMKYRSLEVWKEILARVFRRKKIRIIQTPHKIFNIGVIG